MKTKTPKQLHEQWERIAKYLKTRGLFMPYYEIFAKYCNRMADYNGAAPYWHNAWHYTDTNNAPVPVNIYTK